VLAGAVFASPRDRIATFGRSRGGEDPIDDDGSWIPLRGERRLMVRCFSARLGRDGAGLRRRRGREGERRHLPRHRRHDRAERPGHAHDGYGGFAIILEGEVWLELDDGK
jgi:hypothetical protein